MSAASAGQTVKLAIRPERVRDCQVSVKVVRAALRLSWRTVSLWALSILSWYALESRPDVVLQIQLPADGGLPFHERDQVDLLLDDGAIHLFPETERHAA